MRNITNTEAPNWNPVPLVRGTEDWESNKQDNFGQILFPPVAPMGQLTIPALYIIPQEIAQIGLGTSGLQVLVVDLYGQTVADITQNCTIGNYGGNWYLKVPPVSANVSVLGQNLIQNMAPIVYIRFVGLTNAQGWYDRMLCSEPYQIRNMSFATGDTVEKQGTVTLRWWSASDFVVEQANNEFLLPYEQMDHYFEVSFDAQLSKPEYKKTQEGYDRDGLFFPEKTVVTKEYHFFFNAPEYLLDALRYIHLADYVEIQQGITFLRVDNIDFNIKWESEGDIAKVDCSFTTGTVLRRSGTIEA